MTGAYVNGVFYSFVSIDLSVGVNPPLGDDPGNVIAAPGLAPGGRVFQLLGLKSIDYSDSVQEGWAKSGTPIANGRTIAHHDRVNRGAGDRALNREDITRKFLENAEFGMSRSRAEEMLQVLLSLERFSGREIARAVSLGERF